MSNTADVERQIAERERQWTQALLRRDVEAMNGFLADDYFLAIGVQGMPLQFMPRANWIAALPTYVIHEWTVDDMRVQVHGDTAVALMLVNQKATVAGRDRSGQFFLTDIWVKNGDRWKVAARHSSRPEQGAQVRPQ